MKITTMNPYFTITRQVTVEGGPLLTQQNSSVGRRFRPETVTVKYHWRESAWATVDVTVIGPVIKKDGTESQNTARNSYWPGDAYSPASPWMVDVCDTLRPTHTPAVPTGTFEIKDPSNG